MKRKEKEIEYLEGNIYIITISPLFLLNLEKASLLIAGEHKKKKEKGSGMNPNDLYIHLFPFLCPSLLLLSLSFSIFSL